METASNANSGRIAFTFGFYHSYASPPRANRPVPIAHPIDTPFTEHPQNA